MLHDLQPDAHPYLREQLVWAATPAEARFDVHAAQSELLATMAASAPWSPVEALARPTEQPSWGMLLPAEQEGMVAGAQAAGSAATPTTTTISATAGTTADHLAAHRLAAESRVAQMSVSLLGASASQTSQARRGVEAHYGVDRGLLGRPDDVLPEPFVRSALIKERMDALGGGGGGGGGGSAAGTASGTTAAAASRSWPYKPVKGGGASAAGSVPIRPDLQGSTFIKVKVRAMRC